MRKKIFIIGICICAFFLAMGDSYAINPSKFKEHNLKGYVKIKIPVGWKIIPKEVMDQIDTSTEAQTGIGQGNNEILIAANCYTKKKSPSATIRVSIRHKEMPNGQFDIQNYTRTDIQCIKENNLEILQKNTPKDLSITNYSLYRNTVGGKFALTSKRILVNFKAETTNIIILHIIPYEKGIIKIQYSMDFDEEYFEGIFKHIEKSIKIL